MKPSARSLVPLALLFAGGLPLGANDFPSLSVTPTSGSTTTFDLRLSSAPTVPGLTLNYDGTTTWFNTPSYYQNWLWTTGTGTDAQSVMSLDTEGIFSIHDTVGNPAVSLWVNLQTYDSPAGLSIMDKGTGRLAVLLQSGFNDYDYMPSLILNDPLAVDNFGRPKSAVTISSGHTGYSTDYPGYFTANIQLWDRTSNATTAPIVIDAGSSGAMVAPAITISGSPVITQTAGDARYLRPTQTQFQLGTGSAAQSSYSFAFGDRVRANGLGAVAMGASNYNGGSLNSETAAMGVGATAFGWGSHSSGEGAVAIGSQSQSVGDWAISVGYMNDAHGGGSIAFGQQNYADMGMAFGGYNQAGYGATAIGQENSAGPGAYAFGTGNTVSPSEAIAVGWFNTIHGYSGMAFGYANVIPDEGYNSSIAVGYSNTSSGFASFAGGYTTIASGERTVALGSFAEATGFASVALGTGTRAESDGQFVVGNYNDPTADTDALFVIGSGWDLFNGDGPYRQNAFVVRWNGDTDASGNLNSKKDTGYNKFKAPILVPEGGDISMGQFKAGEEP